MASGNPWADLDVGDAELQALLDQPHAVLSTSGILDDEQHKGFDAGLGNSWIYPSNLPCRAYQMSIAQAALYHNTLVVLPTGLGKTFIAAVVMFNLYRWYPLGKVIFMAPTRPLVHQQIEACQSHMPFPRSETVELTGKIAKAKRAEMWKQKRVFFATPQVVQSDILGGPVAMDDSECNGDESIGDVSEFPFDDIKLVVIDEAHRAKGKYAYVTVLRAIAAKTKYFRVLALSATPGRTMEDVAEVCRNLLISHLEVRWDTSIDVTPYVHKRHMETIVVPFGERIREVREELLLIIDPYLRQLVECQVLSGSLANINRNFLVFEQKRYHERCLNNSRPAQHSAIISNFAICISLYHSLELLERHGTRVFLNYFEEDSEGKAKFVVKLDSRLRQLLEELKRDVGPNPFDMATGPMMNGQIATMPKDLDFGHPKFEKARESLLKHFELRSESRAIVFCEYRESVLLVYRMLLQHSPLLRPRCFVGQGGTGALRALTQKQQMQIMEDFRCGKSNVLIATSIGEEGIDVGEVELIVCFDISTSNPTRFVQRIGRTGRKKAGAVVMLVTEGKEQQILREVLNNKDQVNKKILQSTVVQQALYKNCPRLVPSHLKPTCERMHIQHREEVPKEETKISKKSSKPKQSISTSQDLRNFFTKKPAKQMDANDLEYFEATQTQNDVKPGACTQQRLEKSFEQMKSLFKDLQSPMPSQTKPRRLQSAATGSKSSEVIDLCDDNSEGDASNTNIENSYASNPEISRIEKLALPLAAVDGCRAEKEFLRRSFVSTQTATCSQTNDLKYHLECGDMSNEMKYVLLASRADTVAKNMEQFEVLNALNDFEASNKLPEEKNIMELNALISKIFGGPHNVRDFLQEKEVEKCMRECGVISAISDDDTDTSHATNFNDDMAVIFLNLKTTSCSSETYEWTQRKVRSSRRYSMCHKSDAHKTSAQQSMVYKTLVDNDEENCHSIDEVADISGDLKNCSQWQEFNNQELAFKSTPLRSIGQRSNATARSTLLSKLEETEEDEREQDNSKLLESLKICERSLNDLLDRTMAHEASKPCVNWEDDSSSMSRASVSTTGSLLPVEYSEAMAMGEIGKDVAVEQNHEASREGSSGSQNATLENSPKSNTNACGQPKEDEVKHDSNMHGGQTQALDLAQELNFDMDIFMQPLMEEEKLLFASKCSGDSFKENSEVPAAKLQASDVDKCAKLNQKPSLSSKLASKLNIQRTDKTPNITSMVKQPLTSSVSNIASPNRSAALSSPSKRLSTQQIKTDKSPSLFEMYQRNAKDRAKIPKALTKCFSSSLLPTSTKRQSPVQAARVACSQNESPLVIKKCGSRAAKRRILDSDSENSDASSIGLTAPGRADDSNSDFEEIASSQVHKESIIHRRRKRMRCNSFIEQEAALSGDDASEDEAEHSFGGYLLDSVVVSDGEEDAASTSHMQAMYLQSIKSPEKRGAFRIPQRRQYNDHSRIFSQAVLPEEVCSQYVPDSFVMDEEENEEALAADVSECPLEKAEKILKERRKAKRRAKQLSGASTSNKRPRKALLVQSSSDSEFE